MLLRVDGRECPQTFCTRQDISWLLIRSKLPRAGSSSPTPFRTSSAKRARGARQQGKQVVLRMEADQIASIEAWAKPMMQRESEAIRRLAEPGVGEGETAAGPARNFTPSPKLTLPLCARCVCWKFGSFLRRRSFGLRGWLGMPRISFQATTAHRPAILFSASGTRPAVRFNRAAKDRGVTTGSLKTEPHSPTLRLLVSRIAPLS